jgi:predicted RNA-binding Zn-ribbon protein involved in translation (DUF1610 family)
MDDTLCWTTIECSKPAPTAHNPHRCVSNTYDIALDASKVWGQKFSCPCCGEELHIELADKGDIPKELRKEIIGEKRTETREHFITFAGTSAFLLAAMAARLFLFSGAEAAGFVLNFIVIIIFALIWLPYFIFMIWTSKLTSSGVYILRDFERKHPGEIIVLVEAGKSDCSHTLEYFPEMEAEDVSQGRGLAEQI